MSTCGLAYGCELGGDWNGERSLSQRSDELATPHSFRARPGQRYRLRQITSVVPGVSHGQPEMQASRLVAMARHQTFDGLRADNQDEWHELWKSRINLVGAERRWQEMADAAFDYLNSSVHASSVASTSIFGLATWKNYHYSFRPCNVGY